jgi:hypothetical protein
MAGWMRRRRMLALSRPAVLLARQSAAPVRWLAAGFCSHARRGGATAGAAAGSRSWISVF